VAIGWQLSMGELSAPHDAQSGSLLEDGNWMYAGPDGSERPFARALRYAEDPLNPQCTAPCQYGGQADVALNGLVGYTIDSSYMRLMRIGPQPVAGGCRSKYRLDFPDGTHHVFESTSLASCSESYSDELNLKYRLAEIDDNFGNNVMLTYDNDPSPTTITVSDSTLIGYARRSHTIHLGTDPLFYQYSGSLCSVNSDFCSRNRVYQVDLAGPPNAQGQPTTSTFSFDITPPTTVSLPCGDQTIIGNRTASVRFLQTVHRPDGSTYAMWNPSTGLYYTQEEAVDQDGNIPCSNWAAHINRLNLPTGGHIAYTAGGRLFPRIPTSDTDPFVVPTKTYDPKSGAFATVSIGLATRQLYVNDNDQTPATWKYDADLENPTTYNYRYNGNPHTATIKQEEAVRVTDPAGFTTVHYFDVFHDELIPGSCFTGGTEEEYGLPFVRSTTSGGMFLSTESFAGECSTWSRSGSCPTRTCTDAGGHQMSPLRRTFVVYDHDLTPPTTDHWGFLVNARLRGTRTETVNLDGSLTDTDTVSSDFDGLGHYRTETTTSNVPSTPTRTVTTHYNSNPQAGTYDPNSSTNDPTTYMILPSSPWLTGLYDRVDTTEGSHTARQEFSFNVSTGFLNSRRTLANGTTESSADLLATFTSTDGHGNVTHESYSGGDRNTNGSDIADYGLTHTYTAGTLATSTFDSSGFYTVDNDVDPYSGLVTASRDSAGQPTTYGYDSMYRIILERQPSGGAATKIAYPTGPPVAVTVDRYALTDTSYQTPLAQQRYYYDGLGRLIESKNLMPDGWSTGRKDYDGLGRIVKAFEPEYHGTGNYELFDPAHHADFTYDFMGRTVHAAMPDGSSLWQLYDGARTTKRETIAGGCVPAFSSDPCTTSLSPLNNTVTENYDGYGRLIAIQEASDPQNPATPVTTTYGYDIGNRLVSVSTPPQSRTFTYDDRGFLLSETHPELGAPRTYSKFDSRGHGHHADIGGTSSVDFSFDAAERPTQISSGGSVLKEFYYGAANSGTNYKLGRLDYAVRHNSVTDTSNPFTPIVEDVTVKDQYEYDGVGRISKKTTTLKNSAGTVADQVLPQTYTHNALGGTTGMDFPVSGNGVPFHLSQTFLNGMLRDVTSFTPVNSHITYAANGMVTQVPHADGSTDVITPDTSGMSRQQNISFQGWTSCVVSQPNAYAPVSVCPNSTSNQAFVANSDDSHYHWSIVGGQITAGADTSDVTFNAGASGSVTLTVTITNNCGSGTFQLSSVPITAAATATVTGSTTIAPGQSATLSASLTGTAPWTLYWSDGFSQTVNASPATHTVTQSTTTTYTVTSVSDAGGCGGTASGSATVTVQSPINPPSSITATAASLTSVQVSWSPVTGATSYDVYRDGFFVANSTATALLDNGVTSSTAYLYTVRSRNSTTQSSDSPVDLAVTIIFTNDPQLKIRAVDITSLRAAVNAVRARSGLGAYNFTDPDSTLANHSVKGVHIQELRSMLNDARSRLALGAWSFTDPNVDPAMNGGLHYKIKWVHITDLRGGVQ
jgi:YD repeat-containing protein